MILRQEANAPAAEFYLESPEGTEPLPVPVHSRIPVTVILKDFAAWLEKQSPDSRSMINYLREKINERAGAQISGTEFADLLTQESWLFCFDGLDEVPAASNRSLVLELFTSFL